ncbi:DoxX family protein [Nesterenkonia lutea]|uniref:Membrane protein n=1 Tax=Nesterenkonia lutea TaxID=272919 RepID=A0ABR9JHF4_9MICC|nr:hypothetical protein [Nesterenkonia lutea]MBE1525365.1 putative membrane protein [Nesterenkonia lutea]
MNTDQQALALAGLLSFTGALHLLHPSPFDSIVPPQLGNRRAVTYASGVAELGCAVLLAVPATRNTGGLCTAALMLAVYPANIYSVKRFWSSPRARAVTLARLPLQIPLVRAGWNVARAQSPTGLGDPRPR